MKGAIFFSGKYGSTEQYSKWISEATGLPAFDIKDASAGPLESTTFWYWAVRSRFSELSNRKWVKEQPKHPLRERPRFCFRFRGLGPAKNSIDG
jgi:hypothetical protein